MSRGKDTAIELAWDWLEREVEPDFFEKAGHYPLAEAQERFKEIPRFYKLLASLIITMACKRNEKGQGGSEPFSCVHFRHLIFLACKEIKEKGLELPLPYYWWVDGPMIKPEWIVRITNGIIGWTCDSSVDACGIKSDGVFGLKGYDMDECRFYRPPEAKKL